MRKEKIAGTMPGLLEPSTVLDGDGVLIEVPLSLVPPSEVPCGVPQVVEAAVLPEFEGDKKLLAALCQGLVFAQSGLRIRYLELVVFIRERKMSPAEVREVFTREQMSKSSLSEVGMLAFCSEHLFRDYVARLTSYRVTLAKVRGVKKGKDQAERVAECLALVEKALQRLDVFNLVELKTVRSGRLACVVFSPEAMLGFGVGQKQVRVGNYLVTVRETKKKK